MKQFEVELDIKGKLKKMKQFEVELEAVGDQTAKEMTQELSYVYRYFSTVLDMNLGESVWINKETLPLEWIHKLATLSLIVYMIAVLYFSISTWQSNANSTFISLNPDSGVCNEVPKIIQVLMAASSNYAGRGVWATLPDYQQNSTSFKIQLESYSSTTSTFVTYMTQVQNKLELLSLKSYRRGLAWQYIVWSTFIHRVKVPKGDGTGQFRFFLMGDLTYLYNTDWLVIGITNRHTSCLPETVSARWLASSLSIRVTLPKIVLNPLAAQAAGPGFTLDPKISACSSHVELWQLGYAPPVSETDLTFDIDVQSTAIALAVNMGLISLSSLEITDISIVSDMSDYAKQYCIDDISCYGYDVIDIIAYYEPLRYGGM